MVILNTTEAKVMVAMMNKQAVVYLYHYLIDIMGIDKDFVQRLLLGSLCPTLVHEVLRCKWNKK